MTRDRIPLLSFIAAIACLMWATGGWAQTANAPIGNRDGVEARSGTFFTWGWTCDPDNWPMSLTVHIYIDGTYSTGKFAGATTANVQRGDVSSVCSGTSAHGYGFYLPSQFLTTGTHTIYAYAIDNGGVGPNPLLGGSPLSYTVSAPPPAPPTCSSASPQAPTTTAAAGLFYVYAYGIQNATSVMFPTWADSAQRDLVWYPGTNLGNGTWRAAIDMGQHFAGNPIYGTFITHVYGSNSNYGNTFLCGTTFQRIASTTYSVSGRTGTAGALVSMAGRSVTADANGAYTFTGVSTGTYTITASGAPQSCSFSPSALTVTVGPSASNANFTTQCEKSWAPRFSSATATYRECDGSGSCQFFPALAAPYWAFSNTNEVPVPPDKPTHGVASIPHDMVGNFLSDGFVAKGDGTYKAVLTLDKITNDINLAPAPGSALDNNHLLVPFSTTFSTTFVDESFGWNGRYPSLGDELWLDLRAKLAAHAVYSGAQPVPPLGLLTSFPYQGFPSVSGMSRLTVGIAANWDGTTKFLEVVLWRDPAFDSCTNARQSWWSAMIPTFDTSNSWVCDPYTPGLFDRRGSFGTVELAYFYAPSLRQIGLPAYPALQLGGTNSYSLPVTSLFKWYFQAGRSDLSPPVNGWSTATIGGVYLGIEMWGKARTSVELDNYRLYSVRR